MEKDEFEHKWASHGGTSGMRFLVTTIGIIQATNMSITEVEKISSRGMVTKFYNVRLSQTLGEGYPVHEVATIRLDRIKEVL